MISYRHADIGQWAADTAQYTSELLKGSSALRRSSFSSSTASESSLVSDRSHQSSATFSTNTSFTATEQEVVFDSGSGNDIAHGKVALQQWRAGVQPYQGSAEQQSRDAWNRGALERQKAHGLVAPWSRQTLLKGSQSSTNIHNAPQAWTGLANHCGKKSLENTQQALLSQACSHLQRRVATDSQLHGSVPVPHPAGTNPRRTSTARTWCKPSLVRQQERRDDFVLNLVECATQLVAHLWPNATTCPTVTLNFFIQETLRRSRSTYSTLQLTLYYLYLVKSKGRLLQFSKTNSQNANAIATRGMQCGRRMFLAALILASKYLQDRNFSTNAWTKITNLPAQEINTNEKIFLGAIEYSLHLPLDKYNEWCSRVQGCVDYATLGLPCPWAEVLQEYAAAQAPRLLPHSYPSTNLTASSQLPSLPVFDGAGTIASTSSNNNGDELSFPKNIPEICTPSSMRSQTTNSTAPLAPIVDRKPSTPHSSSWSTSRSASAAGLAGIRSVEECASFINMQLLSQSGSSKAPESAANAAGLATSQSADKDVAMFLTQAEFSNSPLSLSGSEQISFQRSRPQLSRGGTGSSAACYFPSPLRSSMTPQLPTPPLSARSSLSTATELLEPCASFGTKQSASSVNVASRLARRVALEVQKHGLNTVTLPPMKAQNLYESFSDCSSDVHSDFACINAEGRSALSNTTDSPSVKLDSLPAITHILSCGLREHLKPVMQMKGLHQSPASDVEAAKTLGSLKRGFPDAEDASTPVSAKVRRTVSCPLKR